uniref:Ubiquitin-protein ligase n=1 Tax=Solanum tuberosum TaxID=4113 RepID=M1D0W8_SOLTU
MSHLLDEITMLILSNLPVKSLLRFKCVSKSWGCWISSPNFQLSNQQRDGVMIMFTTRSTRDSSFQFIYQQLTFEELDYPCMMSWHHTQKYFRLLGSCHGLILIHVDEHIYLWNPATRFCTKVLELDRLNDDDYFMVGLGVLN